MNNDDYEKEFLREKIKTYRDLLEVAYRIMLDKNCNTNTVKLFEERLLEYGVIDKKRDEE